MILNVVAAFVLDSVFGDPRIRAHPVRLIGSMLYLYERVLYRMQKKFLGGLLLVLWALGTVFAITLGLQYLLPFFSLPFGVNVLLIGLFFFLFCNRDLVGEAKAVCRYLEMDRIEDARKRAARIVGRDTENLGQKDLIRATVESVAENIVDGFTAPLFYLVLGGMPLAYMYKTVNTVDSCFGYRSERYERFGKFGARFDDLLNFIPARLNGFFILCAAGFRRDVLRSMVRYARAHPSPNSGISEAGFAGYLGISLGGPSTYGGAEKFKPWIGEDRLGEVEKEDPDLILRAVSFYWKAVTLTLVLHLAALFLLELPLLFRLSG
jgi:adenosylcobinamide-phosphate synthase